MAMIALPTLATLAADPIASLVDTAYIGHLGMPKSFLTCLVPTCRLHNGHSARGSFSLLYLPSSGATRVQKESTLRLSVETLCGGRRNCVSVGLACPAHA